MFTTENASHYGRKGFKAHAKKWFGTEEEYKKHLAERCRYNYWRQSGRPTKYGVDGRPIFPARKPVHPSVKSGIPF